MHAAVEALRDTGIAGYVALAGIASLGLQRRRDRASAWAAAAFGCLGLLALAVLVEGRSAGLQRDALLRVELLLLAVVPSLLAGFASTLGAGSRRAATALAAPAATLVGWTLALPRVPRPGESWPGSVPAFAALLLASWTALAGLAATRLWRAGRGEPTAVRRRLQLLAAGTGALTGALLLLAAARGTASDLSLGAGALALAAACLLALGLAPPRLARVWWRQPEQAHLDRALASLLAVAASPEEIAARVLEPAAAIVGARAVAIRDADGAVVGSWSSAAPHAGLVELDLAGGNLALRTSPSTAFFGSEELGLARTLGTAAGVALDRVRVLEAERRARLELERTSEAQAGFIALAAHELRTPMTTIHGVATTLHQLGDRLDGDQESRLRSGLIQQTQRMTLLLEQLLDLSRLDAEAVEIAPEPLRVREHLAEIVSSLVSNPSEIEIDVADDVVAEIDRHALERIVSNLVTNALRYGAPPVVVRAERADGRLRLSVEDGGSGVPAEFVPSLFQRFTRRDSRAFASGTGLGLAIARSYANAHGGDLNYEPALPHGARFQLVLPVSTR